MLFDEVEDVFNDGDIMFGRKSTAQTRKAWINRMLEQNQVPALWLSNSVNCLDPAFARRFDMIIELPVPPRRIREKILRQTCGELADARVCGAHLRRRQTRASRGDPGGAGRPCDSAGSAGGWPDARHRTPDQRDPGCARARPSEKSRCLQRARPLRSGLRQCRCRPRRRCRRRAQFAQRAPVPVRPAGYRERQLTPAGWQTGSARRCMRAAPPTLFPSGWAGRNAIWRACSLDAEQSDAGAVARRGRQLPAGSRAAPSAAWEVSEVNEMLTQMEGFAGIFIASTNLMTSLDPAALRRFDLKLAFGYMKPAQLWALFRRECEVLHLADPHPGLESRLAHLACATPGDSPPYGASTVSALWPRRPLLRWRLKRNAGSRISVDVRLVFFDTQPGRIVTYTA